MIDELTADEIAAHFSAMDDSVRLINATIADDTEALSSESVADVKLMITRNTDHLEIQAAKDWYSESSLSKASYTDAVTAGKAYVAV
jgi:hypothetical protein|tara:strand:+ start:795 stop:1055 length:261 start_codon:yes stop_codon:yes gene_type:complete